MSVISSLLSFPDMFGGVASRCFRAWKVIEIHS